MRKTRRIVVIGLGIGLIVGLGGLGGVALGQKGPYGRPQRSPEEEREIRETMLTLMSLKMKQQLDLTEEQERDIMPLLEELQEIRGNARRDHRSRMEELRRLVEDPGSSDRDIEAALDQLRSSQRATEARQREVREEIDRNLSVRQQAQMLFFEARFRREMEHRIRSLHHMHGEDRFERRRQREGGDAGDPYPGDPR